MIGRFVNLPFKVLGSVARAVQEREAARWAKEDTDSRPAEETEFISLEVSADFDPGPIRITAKRAVKEPAWLLDVGTDAEWAEEHADGATHIPVPEIGIRLAELPPNTRIIIYDRGGHESEQVVRFLRFRGVDETWSLRGGLAAWSRAGGPVTQGKSS